MGINDPLSEEFRQDLKDVATLLSKIPKMDSVRARFGGNMRNSREIFESLDNEAVA